MCTSTACWLTHPPRCERHVGRHRFVCAMRYRYNAFAPARRMPVTSEMVEMCQRSFHLVHPTVTSLGVLRAATALYFTAG